MEGLLSRFLRYVVINTQSNENSKGFPSSRGQVFLAKKLAKELKKIGLDKVILTKYSYVIATLKANTDRNIPKIGFIAHLDTSPDAKSEKVSPIVIRNYDGTGLSESNYPNMQKHIGEDVVLTDGTTLLGADDKAGIAEIITAIEYLINHPEIIHGEIKIAFMPDEEIGCGSEHFDVENFNVDFAYTIDGGALGEIEYENFNAAKIDVNIVGKRTHLGDGKKHNMINAIVIFNEFFDLLPKKERPENTEKYDGYYHIEEVNGDAEKLSARIFIRDFSAANFGSRKELIRKIADDLNKKYKDGTVSVEIKDQYFNMREKIVPVFHIVELAKEAMKEVGVIPKEQPIRGGTDGARLSFMGIPTPNIFAGGENIHTVYEYVSINCMEKAVAVILKIIELISKEK